MASRRPTTTQPSINDLLRDERFLKLAGQVIFVAIVIAGLMAIGNNALSALSSRGIATNFEFFDSRAGFGIFGAESYYSPEDSYIRAFFVGLENTLRVIGVSLVMATVIGIFFGIFLLSGNFLVRTIARVYVEVLRNTPLLVQLFAWFFVAISALPNLQDSILFPATSPLIALNNRGLYIADFIATPRMSILAIFLIVAVILAIIVSVVGGRLNRDQGRNIRTGWISLGLVIGLAVVGWLVAVITNPVPEQITIDQDGETITVTRQEALDEELLTTQELAQYEAGPFLIIPPERRGLRYVAGSNYSAPYLALVLGLTIYTSAFIAEIVRAGIQAVDKGQVEASRALGFTYGQTLQRIILPQALRVIIPPMGNQYLNLAKNSSLAIAISYPDVFQVSNTIINQSGQTVSVFILIMGTYLTISLTISLFMNYVNRRFQLVTR